MLSRSRPVSIEIGTRSVKVAQLIERGKSIGAVRFAEQALPEGYHWEIGGDPGPVVEAIRKALSLAGIRAKHAVFSLQRSQVTARVSAFPQADRNELRQVVEYDLADHIPFPIDHVVVDFQQLGPSRDEPGLEQILVVAAPRELLREHLRVAEALGLTVVAVTVDALALDDIAKTLGREPSGMALSIEIDPRTTTINVSDSETLRLTRSVGVGGEQLTRAIQEDFKIESAEAEQLKRSDGLRVLEREPQAERVRSWLDNLIGEIKRSSLTFGASAISRIVILGADAGIPGIADHLATEFGAEPISLTATDVFPEADFRGPESSNADACLMTMAAGLRGIGRSIWSISLLPPEVGRARRRNRTRRLSITAGAFVVLAVALLYLASARQVRQLAADVSTLRQQAELAAQNQTQAEALLAERDLLRAQADALDIVGVRRYAALELLRSLSLYSPKEITLTFFTLRPDQPLQIRGSAPNSAVIAELQHSMGLSPLVTEARLTGADRSTSRHRTAKNLNFTMEFHLWTERTAETQAALLRRWEVQP